MSLGQRYGFILSVWGLLFSQNLFGEDSIIYKTPKTVAVQDRTYHLTNEVSLNLGYLPLDSFTRYVMIAGNFTHYFSDFLGWEILNAGYASSIPSGLEQELFTKFGQQPIEKDFDILNYYLSSNVLFTPAYSKHLLFEDTILYGETSFAAGLALSKFEDSNFVSGINFGVVMKFLLSNSISMKLDMREHIYFTGKTKQHLMIFMGAAYNFGGSEGNVQPANSSN